MIDSFTGKYDFLSNFYNSPVSYNGVMYKTLEHAFQAQKCVYQDDHDWVAGQRTPGEAKRAGSQYGLKGRFIELRHDWEERKIDIMLTLLRKKFELPSLREKLLATGDQELIEGNWWNDTFWGVVKGVGQNHLGRLLMQIRKEIRDDRNKKENNQSRN